MINKVSLIAILTILFSAFCFAADADNAVVRVNGAIITEREVQGVVAKKMPWSAFHKNVSEETMKKLRDEAIESLIDNELVYQASQGQMTVTDDELQNAYDNTRKGFKSEEEFEAAMKKSGLSEDSLKSALKRQLMISRMLDNAVTKPSRMSEEEIRDYYEKNKSKYNDPGKMMLREIFFGVPSNATAAERQEKKKKAEIVMEKIKAGGDFGLLAWEFSEDKFKYKSGEIGAVHEGMLSPEIEKEVVRLQPKEATGIIDTIYGYYIFYLEERTPARQLEFIDVKEKLTKELSGKREKALREEFLSGLRQKAEIKRL